MQYSTTVHNGGGGGGGGDGEGTVGYVQYSTTCYQAKDSACSAVGVLC